MAPSPSIVIPAGAGTHFAFGKQWMWGDMGSGLRRDDEVLKVESSSLEAPARSG